jgi:hypothetical protein
VVCFGSAISHRGLRGIARLGLLRNRRKEGKQEGKIWVNVDVQRFVSTT